MGAGVGILEGRRVDGLGVGTKVGSAVGRVGCSVGKAVGCVGAGVGCAVGLVGRAVGERVGYSVGIFSVKK